LNRHKTRNHTTIDYDRFTVPQSTVIYIESFPDFVTSCTYPVKTHDVTKCSVYLLPIEDLRPSIRGVNWADLMTAQGASGTNFYDRSTRTIVGTMLWTEDRPVLKSGPKTPWAAMRSAQFTPLEASDRVYIKTDLTFFRLYVIDFSTGMSYFQIHIIQHRN